MKLLVIFGSGAVGKMTVGQELTKITDLRLFHNHMPIELVLDVFGGINKSAITKIRGSVFEEFAKTNKYGLIFTYMLAFDVQSDWDNLNWLIDIFRKENAEIFYVELVASQEIRLQRNATENRLRHKASNRDVEVSNQRLINEDTKYRLFSNDDEITFDNYIKIDNSHLAPDVVARMIKEKFEL